MSRRVSSKVRQVLLAAALSDARETFLGEQIAYWYYDYDTRDPDPPDAIWCHNALDWQLTGRYCTADEWELYERQYLSLLKTATLYVRRHWDAENENWDYHEEFSAEVEEAIFSR